MHPTPIDATPSRPAMLWQAVRHGLAAYRRDTVLRRLLGTVPPAAEAARILAAVEARLEAARLAADSGYSPATHLEALIALVAEGAAARAPVAKAGGGPVR
jgi:hypothetical protein